MKRRWLQILLVVVGALLVIGHLVALAFLGMTASNWISGTVIGLALAVLGGAHLLLAHAPHADESRTQQTVFGLLALAIGLLEGIVAIQVDSLGAWLLVPWALSALAIGWFLAGPPVEKAARLATFGFASVLVLVCGSGDVTGVGGFAAAAAWSALGAAAAVAIGAAAHAFASRAHAH